MRIPALDEIEHAHRQVGGGGRGRRYATQQINHAYAVLLSSQFQAYCRDLHSECVFVFIANLRPPSVQAVLRGEMLRGRTLDRGNPNPGNLGSDFNRLGLNFWDEVYRRNAGHRRHNMALAELNLWRNAIAHQDFTDPTVGGQALRLQTIRTWRRACTALVTAFDTVMAVHLGLLFGTRPW